MLLKIIKPPIGLFLLSALLLTVLGLHHPWRPEPSGDALTIWRKSLTQGADTPMRAEMQMTQRHHGITYPTEAHIVQGAKGRYRMEYVLPEEARGRIVFSDGETNWQYEPKQNLLAKTPMVAMTEQKDREVEELIESNYQIALVSDQAQAAGRPAYLLDLWPNMEGKSSQRRWIDKQTYKTLRIETHYTDGILARMVMYDHVALPATVTDADFLPMHTKTTHIVDPPATEFSLATRVIPTRYANLGLKSQAALSFQLIEISSSQIDNAPAIQLLYTDGIETVSIFVQNSHESISSVPSNWQALTIKGHPAFQNLDGHLDAITWIENGHRYTAVSHLTPHALQTVVESQLSGL